MASDVSREFNEINRQQIRDTSEEITLHDQRAPGRQDKKHECTSCTYTLSLDSEVKVRRQLQSQSTVLYSSHLLNHFCDHTVTHITVHSATVAATIMGNDLSRLLHKLTHFPLYFSLQRCKELAVNENNTLLNRSWCQSVHLFLRLKNQASMMDRVNDSRLVARLPTISCCWTPKVNQWMTNKINSLIPTLINGIMLFIGV